MGPQGPSREMRAVLPAAWTGRQDGAEPAGAAVAAAGPGAPAPGRAAPADGFDLGGPGPGCAAETWPQSRTWLQASLPAPMDGAPEGVSAAAGAASPSRVGAPPAPPCPRPPPLRELAAVDLAASPPPAAEEFRLSVDGVVFRIPLAEVERRGGVFLAMLRWQRERLAAGGEILEVPLQFVWPTDDGFSTLNARSMSWVRHYYLETLPDALSPELVEELLPVTDELCLPDMAAALCARRGPAQAEELRALRCAQERLASAQEDVHAPELRAIRGAIERLAVRVDSLARDVRRLAARTPRPLPWAPRPVPHPLPLFDVG